jgi:hypothetical protein
VRSSTVPVHLKWRWGYPGKITERTHEEATEAVVRKKQELWLSLLHQDVVVMHAAEHKRLHDAMTGKQ